MSESVDQVPAPPSTKEEETIKPITEREKERMRDEAVELMAQYKKDYNKQRGRHLDLSCADFLFHVTMPDGAPPTVNYIDTAENLRAQIDSIMRVFKYMDTAPCYEEHRTNRFHVYRPPEEYIRDAEWMKKTLGESVEDALDISTGSLINTDICVCFPTYIMGTGLQSRDTPQSKREGRVLRLKSLHEFMMWGSPLDQMALGIEEGPLPYKSEDDEIGDLLKMILRGLEIFWHIPVDRNIHKRLGGTHMWPHLIGEWFLDAMRECIECWPTVKEEEETMIPMRILLRHYAIRILTQFDLMIAMIPITVEDPSTVEEPTTPTSHKNVAQKSQRYQEELGELLLSRRWRRIYWEQFYGVEVYGARSNRDRMICRMNRESWTNKYSTLSTLSAAESDIRTLHSLFMT
ncbi:hypothetical protein SBOR_4500 [Sclerotinia borealis F-4128]|uniref:Uncharacterized protein n=1 Tax=Sclerotinia borealis (strain F-4128) TaxID=1432307 RepID=W9CGQ2_SCLBF|nr:hypothetical protein SBOR_4500 [Sclerotinia borealis F-4128]